MNALRWAASGFFLGATFTILWISGAQARPVVLDDSGTEALEPSVALRWKSVVPGRAAGNLMVGTSVFRVRIHVAPWLHRNARIYLVLPAQQPGPLSVSWVTQGPLLPGRLQSGSRALIFSGAITRPFLEDQLKVQFSIDGTLVTRAFPVNLQFEMDE